jgi:hypothetical protein
MKTSKTNPKVFYAVLRKNLIKVNIDDPPKAGGNELVPIKILYESHLNSFFIDNKILDYQFIGEDQIAISTLYAIVIVDEKTQQKLIDFKTHPDHQVHLMLHPQFCLERFPILMYEVGGMLEVQGLGKGQVVKVDGQYRVLACLSRLMKSRDAINLIVIDSRSQVGILTVDVGK